MKHTINILGTFFLLIIAFAFVAAQENAVQNEEKNASIQVRARIDKDQVVLRWAPDRPGAWHLLNKFGYVVERVRVLENGKFEPGGYQRLTPETMTPWSIGEWKTKYESDKENKFLAIAAQMLYGKRISTSKTEDGELAKLKKAVTELSNRYSFALFAADNDAVVADGMGLRLVDRNVREGELYSYRVSPGKEDATYPIDTAYILVRIEAFAGIPAPPSLTAEAGDKKITLHWNDLPGENYSGYFVSRSDDNGATYKPMHANALVFFTPAGNDDRVVPMFIDTVGIVNYKKYRYHVQGLTAFGERSPSAEVEMYARDLTPPSSPLKPTTKQVGKTSVKISWKMPVVSPDLQRLMIGRGPRDQHLNLQMYQWMSKDLSKDAREYVDPKATEDEPYYVVAAIDTAGNIAYSSPAYAIVIDSLPPSPPRNITGIIDTNGVVRLHWQRGKEKDLDGYRVLWANASNHTFIQGTPKVLRDTNFVMEIDLNNLTEHIYFKVVAVDKRFQHSEPSAILELTKPDKVPPSAPVFGNVEVTESSVMLQWHKSSSADLEKQILYKRTQGESEWKKLREFDRMTERYTDTDVKKTVTYEYRIVAVDDAGHTTPCAMDVAGRPFDTGKRPGVERFVAEYQSADKAVKLQWKNPSGMTNEKYWVVIYRALDDKQPTQYKAIDASSQSFLDTEVTKNTKYKYAVKVKTERGGESELSNVELIMIPQ